MRFQPFLAFAVLLSSLVLAACGSGAQSDSATDFEGDQNQVARVVERLEEESIADSPSTICEEVLSRRLAQEIGAGDVRTGCARRVAQALEDSDVYALTVEQVTISGTTATARVRQRTDGDGAERVDVRLVKDGGAWRLDGLPAPAR